ncbi:Uncharacterized protein BM_BM1154 [Brugia malayi]|uniref:Bm1154 n=1 Tax=Brugia malayi TaxID=6279 RepID=A0A0K0IS16_BRUMA|nr:Uncharacterized protein BM_BM1154 [Brugia malayi]CDP91828.1 Bm1154 [Brugia malayi]VIO90280.1 Uncharacterized protein BM_BM1154 [Brugia malayi]
MNLIYSNDKEKTENNNQLLSCNEDKCLCEDEVDLMEHIQILLDSYPKCNFVQQILQTLCNEGTVTEKIIAHLIDRSIRRQRMIQKQIKILKSSQIRKSIADDK